MNAGFGRTGGSLRRSVDSTAPPLATLEASRQPPVTGAATTLAWVVLRWRVWGAASNAPYLWSPKAL